VPRYALGTVRLGWDITLLESSVLIEVSKLNGAPAGSGPAVVVRPVPSMANGRGMLPTVDVVKTAARLGQLRTTRATECKAKAWPVHTHHAGQMSPHLDAARPLHLP
jgi:hypothetical protein